MKFSEDRLFDMAIREAYKMKKIPLTSKAEFEMFIYGLKCYAFLSSDHDYKSESEAIEDMKTGVNH